MSGNIPEKLRYTDEHEWLRKEGDVVVIGITDHAQEALGDVVFLELPEVGTEVEKGQAFGVVESVKAVSDLFAPLAGTVSEVNEALIDAPEKVNESPYDDAWMLKMTPANASDVDALMDAAGYMSFLEKEEK